MNKNLNLMVVLGIALLAGLAPVGTAQAVPFGQVRLPGNLSPRFTYVPGTVLNTQTRLGNLGGSLVSSQTIRPIGAIQTPRIPVVDRITQVAPPMVTLDATRYIDSLNGVTRRLNTVAPMPSLYERVSQAPPDLSVNNGNGCGSGTNNDGGDDDNGGGGDENGGGKKGGGKGGSGAGGNGSGPGYSPPEPPDLNYFYYFDDDDDEREFMGRIHTIIRMYESQVK